MKQVNPGVAIAAVLVVLVGVAFAAWKTMAGNNEQTAAGPPPSAAAEMQRRMSGARGIGVTGPQAGTRTTTPMETQMEARMGTRTAPKH